MTDQREGALAIAASLLVLAAAMVEPIISAGIAFVALAGLGLWKVLLARR